MNKNIPRARALTLVGVGIIACLVYWYLRPDIFSAPVKTVVEGTKKEISSLAPLLGDTKPSNVVLTSQGIWTYTNIARTASSIEKPLSRNAKLDTAARARVDDMFAKQYFEHVSPTGEKASDEAAAAGYEFISLGENIALGNFASDQALVDAWMNSPGHRANIVSSHFTEIGIAAKKGMYDGNEIWIAVQIFGRPLSDCPGPDPVMRARIEANNAIIAKLKAEIEASSSTMTPAQYNARAKQVNDKIAETKALATEYNKQVTTFNACIEA